MPGIEFFGPVNANSAGKNPSVPCGTTVGIRIKIGDAVQLRRIRT
jgi:hypothetical protein